LTGGQLRPGGTLDNNLTVRCVYGLQVGGGSNVAANPNGVSATCTKNVMIQCNKPAWASLSVGYGFDWENIASLTATDNIIANAEFGTDGMAVYINGLDTGAKAHNIKLRNNVVYKWTQRAFFMKGPNVTNFEWSNNDWQDPSNNTKCMEILDTAVLDDFTSFGNRVWTNITPTSNWFLIGGANKSLLEYRALVGDPPGVNPASAAILVIYHNAAGATLSGYALNKLGLTLTTDQVLQKCSELRKGNWQLAYTADNINNYIRACFDK
jgi:hypothetical protein